MINNHKIIGVCVTKVQYRAESIYLTRLNEAAVKMGYKLMIFNSVANSDNSFDAGAKSVYSVINHDIIDVLVILSSTFGVKEIEKAIIAKAHAHGTPVILIDSKEDGCYSIIKQYGKALKAVMNHIIRDHGVRDTFFLAGHRENDPTSDFRIQCFQFQLKYLQITPEGVLILRIPACKTLADILRHGHGLDRGEPDMGILFVMMVVVIFFSLFVTVMVMLLRRDRCDSGRGIDGICRMQDIFHKFFQTGTGDDDELCCLRRADLTDIQGVVMQAADFLRHQPGDGDAGALTQPGGEFIHRQRGGCHPGRGRIFGTAGHKKGKEQ